MTYPRPSAWVLIVVLVVGMLGSAGTAVTIAANPPPQCTGWTDEFHPPTEIRVRLSRGPSAGTVAVVPFWDYVGTVEAAEYSTSGPRGPIWLRMGALAVKEYGWYYAMHWRGGSVTITNEDGTTTTQCYDVRDTTADQIYKPLRLVNGEWITANVPSAAQVQAMAETWPMSLRKWVVAKQKSRFFLTGYSSGKKNPCGTDSDAFKIFQKSLGDCIVKGLNFEEAQRRYYEPNVLIVDPRAHDVLDDPDANSLPTYYGDLGVLTPGANTMTGWRVYAGTDTGFADPVTGAFAIDSTEIEGQDVGDVNGDGRKDLVMMLKTGKIRVALTTGAGYADPTSQDLPNGAPTDQLLVGDFDGDLLVDVGLLRSTPVAPLPDQPATLVVMHGTSSGTFNAPVDWWRGALDLTPVTGQQVGVGDVNGDGRADLVIRNLGAGFSFYVAASVPSCADISIWGPCPVPAGVGLADATEWFNNTDWLTPTPEWALTDFNRDGRSDVVVVVKSGSGVDVFGANATVAGGSFVNQHKMWHADNQSLDDMNVLGIDVNPDGLGDLALLRKNGSNTTVQWLQAVQTLGVVTYSATTGYNDSGLSWAPAATKPY
ncbi:MAG: VCBS repeat-containing protein [Chloroflexota bacterium]|nr:VCBS repeat-containing protein [Chloroflexota bacterium]